MKKLLIVICVCTMALSVIALSGCSGDAKPSKEEVSKSLSSIYLKAFGTTDAATKKRATAYAECIVDAIHPKLSAKTLNAIVDAKTLSDMDKIKGSADEEKVISAAGTKCQSKLVE